MRARAPETPNPFRFGFTYGFSEPYAFEFRSPLVVRVLRRGSTAEAASVRLRTRDLTARAGEDYEAVGRMVEFAPLKVYKDVPIRIHQDSVAETEETFALVLEPAGAPLADAQISILDDDPSAKLKLEFTSAGQIQLTVNSTATPFDVQVSSNLLQWRTITTHTTDKPFVTTIAPSEQPQFFRAAVRHP